MILKRKVVCEFIEVRVEAFKRFKYHLNVFNINKASYEQALLVLDEIIGAN